MNSIFIRDACILYLLNSFILLKRLWKSFHFLHHWLFLVLLWANTQGQVEANPFKLENSPKLKEIASFSIDSWRAGSLKAPSTGIIHFTVKGTKGETIPHLPPHLFEYYLKKDNESWVVKGITVFRLGKYEARLKYPRVSHIGPYELGIKLKSDVGNTDFLSKKKVFYRKDKVNILFILDNSGSMSVNDPSGSRLQAVINLKKNRRLLEIIDKVGVVVFGSQPKVLIPMTSFPDLFKHKTKINLLKPQGKTDVPAALKLAYEELKALDGTSAAVLLTDGVSSVPTAGSHEAFKKIGIPIYTIGLEVKNSSEGFNQTYLKKIAKETGAVYFKSQGKALDRIYSRIVKSSFKTSDKIDFVLPKKRYQTDEYLSLHLKWQDTSAFNLVIKVDRIQVKPIRTIKSGDWRKVYLKPLTLGERELTVSLLKQTSKGDTVVRQWSYVVHVEQPKSRLFTWKVLSKKIKLTPSQISKEGVVLTHHGHQAGFYHLEATWFVGSDHKKATLPLEIIEFIPSFHLLKPKETKLISIAYHYLDDPPAGLYFGNILIESDSGVFGFEKEIVIDHHIANQSKANAELDKQTMPLRVIVPIAIIWFAFLVFFLLFRRKQKRLR